MYNLVLLEPEIPNNTGSIGRSCVATNTMLHLIKPLGFSLEDKYLKRAGLDYWPLLKLRVYENFEDFLEKNINANLYFCTTKAKHLYTDIQYKPNDFFVFGKESAGIPEEILVQYKENCIRIPMLKDIRSLNLANATSIVLYEALRQDGFQDLEIEGDLHRLHW